MQIWQCKKSKFTTPIQKCKAENVKKCKFTKAIQKRKAEKVKNVTSLRPFRA